MEDFNLLECGFNSADETVNFGTRVIGYENLYEISTLACIKSSQNRHSSDISLHSLIHDEKLFLSTNSCMRVFEDLSVTGLLFNAVFEESIDTFCVTPDHKYLIIGLRNGTVVVYDLIENSNIFSVCLGDNKSCQKYYIGFFVEVTTEHKTTVILVPNDGFIFRLFIVSNANPENSSNVTVTSEKLYEFQTSVKTASFSYPLLTFTNGFRVTVCNTANKSALSGSLCKAKVKALFPLGGKFLGLCEDGTLIRICTLTLITFPIELDTLYDDILVATDKTQKIQIIAVTKSNELGHRFIQLLTYPDFTPAYSLKLSHPIVLTQPEYLSDGTFFISEIRDSDSISELRINSVYESIPELRLQKLVERGKLQEAEIFAKTFNVDPSIITKARARQIVDKLSCTSEDIDTLLNILDTIDDDLFKLRCCEDVDWRRVEDVRKILTYAATMKLSKSDTEKRREVEQWQDIFLIRLFRFDTYNTIYSQHNHYDLDAALAFLESDLFEELKTFLKNCLVEEAIILYSRLDIKTIESFSEEKIEDILYILNSVGPHIYQRFLTTFMPVTLHYLPEALTVFVDWLYGRVYQLEKSDSSNFPEVGIEFAEDILKLLNVDTVPTLSQKHRVLDKDSLNKLSKLMNALRDMQILKNNFRINVSISEYFMGPENLIQTLLNVIMDPSDFEVLLKEFLYLYILKSKLDPDELFLEEIKNLLKYEEEHWIKSVEIILKFISSVTFKLQAVIDILKNAKTPWCDSVRQIGRNALEYTHDLVPEIKELLEDETVLVVLKNPKYGISERSVNSISELKYVVNRIAYINSPTMIEDACKLCKNSEDRRVVNKILIQTCIKHEKYKEAMAILDDNTPEEIYACSNELVTIVKGFLQCHRPHLNVVTAKYCEILKPVYRRLIEHSTNDLERQQVIDDFNLIKAVCKIKKEFDRMVSCADLVVPDRKNKLLGEILEVEIQKCSSQPDIQNILTLSETIASCFDINKDDILISFCQNLQYYDAILKAAEHLLEHSLDSKSLCLAAVLLLKWVFGTVDMQSLSDSFAELDTTLFSQDVTNLPVGNYLKGLKVAEELGIKAMINAKRDDHSAVLEVINWVDSCFYLNVKQENALASDLYKNIYCSDNTLLINQSLNAIKDVFTIYCHYIEQFKNPNTRYLTYFSCGTTLSQENFLQEFSHLPISLNNLCSQKHHLTVFKLLTTLQQGLLYDPNSNKNMAKTVRHLIDHYIPQIVQAVAARPHLDDVLFYSLLSMLDEKNCTKTFYNCLKMYKRQVTKLSHMASVGVKLMDKGKIVDNNRRLLVHTVKTCIWWKKIDNIKMQYDQFFKSGEVDRLKTLINENCINMRDIEEYCADFELDVQQYYLYYLKKALLNWKPDVDYTTDVRGWKNISIKNGHEELTKKCRDILDAIDDKEQAYKLLQKIYSAINFYYYEVFISIINIQAYILRLFNKKEDLKKLDLLLLPFLLTYRRSSPPGNSEKEQWYSTFPYEPLVDPLSEFRLPFTRTLFTKDIWDIIRPEISLKTYKEWFCAAEILLGQLKKDDICTYAIKSLVSSRLLIENCPSDKWNLYSKLESLPSDIDECASNISNLETATAVVYHVMKCMPPGADKVSVAKLSYQYAMKYKESKPDSSEVEETLRKVKQQYYNLAATHVLYAYQLAEEKYIRLVANPSELINALYLDERIVRSAQGVDLSCPDINAAVDDLAQLFALNIRGIRYEILIELLNSSSTNIDLEASRSFSNVMNQKTQYLSNNDNLKRAAYICANGVDLDFWQNFLYQSGDPVSTDNNSSIISIEERSCLFKANALKVFYAISDVAAIEQRADVSVPELLDCINKLTLQSDLENFGIVMTLKELENYNKKDLLKRLSKTIKPINIKIMATLCVTYSIDDIRYWEFIINNAVKFDMIPELRVYVDVLKNKCLKSFYINAWQVIINDAFKDCLPEDKLYETYVNNCIMIQFCPVVNMLNFEQVVTKCIEKKKFEFAAVLSQYLPEDKKKIIIQEIIKCQTLPSDLKKLSDRGVYGIKKVKMYLAQFHSSFLK